MSFKNCQTCIDYYEARRPVLAPAIAGRMNETGETAPQILDRYMGGVHDRHLDGLPILTPA